MPSNQTPNYQLSQWERSDKIQMEDFNADNAKIDAALSGKAEQNALAALAQTVSGHTSALAEKGNCRVETISYIGDGVDGQDLTHRLTFSKRPDFVLIFGGRCIFLMPGRSNNGIFIGTYEGLNSRTIMPSEFIWEGSTAVLNNPQRQVRMDATGISYQVIAWIPLDSES